MAAAAATGDQNGAHKQRILCLHGYLQNSEVFRAKAGSLRKGLKSRAEFFFVDAPHLVTGTERDVKEAAGSQDQPRGWWTWQDPDPGMRPSLAHRYAGWEESLAVLIQQLEELRPNAILGFSQGATAAALLLAHIQKEQMLDLRPKFAVLIAGFLPKDERFAGLLDAHQPGMPLLIVHGESDALVPIERSRQLQAVIQGGSNGGLVERFDHSGAHMVPSCSGEFKKLLQSFIDRHA